MGAERERLPEGCRASLSVDCVKLGGSKLATNVSKINSFSIQTSERKRDEREKVRLVVGVRWKYIETGQNNAIFSDPAK